MTTSRRDILILSAGAGAFICGAWSLIDGSTATGIWTAVVGAFIILRVIWRRRSNVVAPSRLHLLPAYGVFVVGALLSATLIILAAAGVVRHEPIFPAAFGLIGLVAAIAGFKLLRRGEAPRG